jgi:hypothetical protein
LQQQTTGTGDYTLTFTNISQQQITKLASDRREEEEGLHGVFKRQA